MESVKNSNLGGEGKREGEKSREIGNQRSAFYRWSDGDDDDAWFWILEECEISQEK